ncbi:MAG: PP2C family protein-serine/threonine phosphatase [Pseudonocardiaceae bacterium]
MYRVAQPESQVPARARVLTDLGAAAGISDPGLRRTRNEDAMALRRITDDTMVVAVADGVSVSHRPHEASRAAVDVAVDVLAAAVLDRADPVTATRQAAAEAATAVAALHRSDEGGTAPACTFVSAVVSGGRTTVGWIGDSRAYWLAEQGRPPSQCLTTDDSWAGHAVRNGRQTPHEAYGDGRTGALWRWLGDAADREPAQVATLETHGSGIFLLCSDGLWSYLWNSEELAAVVREADSPLSAASRLTRFALDSGGRDNVTAVVVAVNGGTSDRSAQAGSSRKESTIPLTWGRTAWGSEPTSVNTVMP